MSGSTPIPKHHYVMVTAAVDGSGSSVGTPLNYIENFLQQEFA